MSLVAANREVKKAKYSSASISLLGKSLKTHWPEDLPYAKEMGRLSINGSMKQKALNAE